MKRGPNLKRDFPRVLQERGYTCGPACLRAVLRYYGVRKSETFFAELLGTTKESGTAEPNIISLAKALDILVLCSEDFNLSDLAKYVRDGHPVLVTYVEPVEEESHYGIVIDVTEEYVRLREPSSNSDVFMERGDFLKRWYGYYYKTYRFALVFKKL
jgi:predicted double-glycine peptidase